MARGERAHVRCPDCGETRPLTYAAVWAIRRGHLSGTCDVCAKAKRRRPLSTRLLEKVGTPDVNGCWSWKGHRDRRGYGRFTIDNRSRLAHRLIYEHFRGGIPDGLELDHLCRNPYCVNPDHLEPVTHAENLRRAAVAAYTDRCPQGHLFDDTNTYVGKDGYRKCRACRRDANRIAYHAKKAVCS